MKKIFCRLDTSDLIKQITVISLLLAFGLALEKPLHFHVGTFHLCFAAIISAFLMISLTNWRLSFIGAFTAVTIGELVLNGHYDFWVNYIPMFWILIFIEIGKRFKNFWISLITLILAFFQFELIKVFVYYLTFGSAIGYAQFIGSLIQIGIGTPVLISLYGLLFKVIKLTNYNIYNYN